MATNGYGLDVDYFTKLCKREFSAAAIQRKTPKEMARALARAARTACPGVLREDEFEWETVRGPGEVRVGDKIRFVLDGKLIKRRVADVLHPGTDKEEVIYNAKRNYYYITSMLMEGKTRIKDVRVRIRPLEIHE